MVRLAALCMAVGLAGRQSASVVLSSGPTPPTATDEYDEEVHGSLREAYGMVAPLKETDWKKAERVWPSDDLKRRLRNVKNPLLIFMLGDSLMRYQAGGMCGMIVGEFPNVNFDCDGVGEYHNVRVKYVWTTMWNPDLLEQLDNRPYPVADADVIYMNAAVHLCQSFPNYKWDLQLYHVWKDYEQFLGDTLKRYRKVARKAEFAIMRAETICEDNQLYMFRQDYLEHKADPIKKALECAEDLASLKESKYWPAVPLSEAKQSCSDASHSFLSRDSIVHLNARLDKFVSTWSADTLIYVDLFNVTDGHCGKFWDGIHAPSLSTRVLTVFFDAIKRLQ